MSEPMAKPTAIEKERVVWRTTQFQRPLFRFLWTFTPLRVLCTKSLSHSKSISTTRLARAGLWIIRFSIYKCHAKFCFLNTFKSIQFCVVSNIVQRCLLVVETVIALTKANAPRRATPSGWSSSLKPSTSSTRIWKAQRTTANADQTVSATVAPATNDGAHNIIDYNNSTPVSGDPLCNL